MFGGMEGKLAVVCVCMYVFVSCVYVFMCARASLCVDACECLRIIAYMKCFVRQGEKIKESRDRKGERRVL